MRVLEAQAKSLLIRRKRVDAWFLCGFGMNLYRGCAHDCAYCDGRAEKYQAGADFGQEVLVKTNAIELLRRELAPGPRKRSRHRHGYVGLGGGVGDSYQPVDAHRGLARQALELLLESGLPVHVLTKSSLVERDLDLLSAIQERAGAVLSMSLSSARNEVSAVFEPGCTRPTRRLETLARAKARGLPTGVYLMPVIPFVTDDLPTIEETLARCGDAGVDFVVFGGMTLKPGRQRDHFQDVLGRHDAEAALRVRQIYGADEWGLADARYYAAISRRFLDAASRRGVAPRMPTRLFRHLLEETAFVSVLLEGVNELRRLRGRPARLWRAAQMVAESVAPISARRAELPRLPGVDAEAAALIEEILTTGTASEYEAEAPLGS